MEDGWASGSGMSWTQNLEKACDISGKETLSTSRLCVFLTASKEWLMGVVTFTCHPS
jgi:hypothetical protein